MANKKISEMTELASTPSSGDLIEIVDISDTSEAATGTNKKVQYSNLVPSQPAASDTVAGIVELATTAETTTGTDATRAVTPDGLHDMTSLAGAAWFLDEDTMASDSSTKVPSQQSVKAYVDRPLISTLNRIPLYAPQGFLINGKISVTDTGSGLNVALKTLAGTDPSATDPIYVRLNDSVRTISQAISVTMADGTNWFNAGSAELATKEIDYFVYLIWNSANSRVSIAVSRIPYYKNWSEVTDSNTSERNFEYDSNFGSAVANDECEVVGRFAATLSAGAGYTWSVPTYTAANLIQHPIYETRVLTWVPTWSCSGSMTYTSVTGTFVYRVSGGQVTVYVTSSGTTGGTASVAIYYTHPFTATASHSSNLGHAGGIVNNSTQTIGMSRLGSGKSECYISTGGNWTLAAGTSINDVHTFEI